METITEWSASSSPTLAARNSALAAERAAWAEAQKLAFQKRQNDLAGERRFIYILFGVILAVVWVSGTLLGG